LKVPKAKREISLRVVENNRAKSCLDFRIQAVKQLMAYQPNIVVVDKLQKKAEVADVAIPSDNKIKKEHKKLKNAKR